MKKAIISAIAIIALIIAFPMILASCSDEPTYYMSDIEYDPDTKLITWYDNTDATEWTVTINGTEHTTTSREFSYDAGTTSFTVKVATKNATENKSRTVTFNYLDTVTGLKVDNGTLTWSPVSGATGYDIYNNGVYQCTVYGGCSYTINPGAFNLSVKPYTDQYSYFCYMSEYISGVVLSAPTNLTYENGVFKWDAVQNADYYKVVINGQEYTTSLCAYEFAGNQQDINIAVYAASNAANSYVSSPLETVCYYLTPITTFSFNEQGELVWPTVENATEYHITLNDMDIGRTSSNFYSDIQLDTTYTICVTPVGGFSYSDAPIAYTFEKLSAVEGVIFADGIVSWNEHAKAQSYEIIVNGNTYTSNTNSYSLGTVKENLEIQVFAIGKIENSRSYMAHTAAYTYIPMVSNIRIEDGILVWDASEGASGYTIKFNNGATNSTQATSYDAIVANQQYVVKIRPEAALEKYYTYDSAEFTFTILEAPYVTYQQGVFRWNGTNDAKGYAFRVVDPTGKTIIENISGDQLTKKYEFTTPGKYTVEVKTIANPAVDNVYDSKYSAALNVTQLADVTGHTIINDISSTAYVQIIANAVADASAYKVYVNGNEYSTPTSNTFSVDLLSLSTDNSEKTFTISIKAIGSITSNNIVLDSKNIYTFNLTRLATPQNVVISGNKISWSNVNNANKYVISIDGNRFECTTSEHTLTALTAGQHTVTVQAINSDSQTFVPSCYSNDLTITKLQAPQNVRVDNGGSNLIIMWDAVTGTTGGYQLQIGSTNKQSVTQTSYNISTHASSLQGGEGSQITVYAMGNGAEVLNSDPSATITIARLNAPTGLSVNGNNITWNPSEVDGIGATSYVLYIDGVEYPVNGTSYSTNDLSAGTHNVQVVAKGSIGNQYYTIDSPESGAITVTKLPEVTNITTNGKSYSWDPINGAEYRVSIDGVEYYTTQPTISVNFTTAGEHKVEIQAYSKQNNTVASNTTVIKQQVSAISTPKFAEGQDPSELDDYTFTFAQTGDVVTLYAKANTSVIAVGYEFYIEGIKYTPANGIHNYEIRDSYDGCKYNIKMKFTANGFGTDGIYYVDSAFSTDVTYVYYSAQ